MKLILFIIFFNIQVFSFNNYNKWFNINNILKKNVKNWFIKRAEDKGIDWTFYYDYYTPLNI